ncbi:MAG: Uncharacterised protein [Cyanobium sp. ARS6]|nr:MAG: Uncharacterised protein [Cyanobium sp. ARS6]
MGKAENLASAQMLSDFLVVDLFLELIGQQHHDPVRFGRSVGNAQHFKAVGSGLVSGTASLIKAHHHVHAAVLEVQRVGMALGAIADDGDRFAAEQRKICIGVVKKLSHPDDERGAW